MAGRWETLILLLCELPAPACAETVDQQRQEVLDEKQKEVHGLKKKKDFFVCVSNREAFFFFFLNGGQENYAFVNIKHLHWLPFIIHSSHRKKSGLET